jgi:hypothetical protein
MRNRECTTGDTYIYIGSTSNSSFGIAGYQNCNISFLTSSPMPEFRVLHLDEG